LIVAPHPSEMFPQFAFCAAHEVGVHPHWFGLEAPHMLGATHVPQLIV
jgi:hypothetical protein